MNHVHMRAFKQLIISKYTLGLHNAMRLLTNEHSQHAYDNNGFVIVLFLLYIEL